jgi:hypothetical protein
MNPCFYTVGPAEDLAELLSPRGISLHKGKFNPTLKELRGYHGYLELAYRIPPEGHQEVIKRYKEEEDGRIVYNFNLGSIEDAKRKSAAYRIIKMDLDFSPIDKFDIPTGRPLTIKTNSGLTTVRNSIRVKRDDIDIESANYKWLPFPWPSGQGKINIGDFDRNDGVTRLINFVEPTKTTIMLTREISRHHDVVPHAKRPYEFPEMVDFGNDEDLLTKDSELSVWTVYYNFKRSDVVAVLIDKLAVFCGTMFENHAIDNIEIIEKFLRYITTGKDVSIEDMFEPVHQQTENLEQEFSQINHQRNEFTPFNVYGPDEEK